VEIAVIVDPERRADLGSAYGLRWNQDAEGGQDAGHARLPDLDVRPSPLRSTAVPEGVQVRGVRPRAIGGRGIRPADVLPAHPVITAPLAAAATGRAKAAIHQAIQQLERCGIVAPLSTSKRNRSWEATGLLELLEGLEAGRLPDSS
jgi:hypothetical protein